MGRMDFNNYVVMIMMHDDMTDPKHKSFVKDWNFTNDEYWAFIKENEGAFYHPLAEKILDFFCNFREGTLRPDKWGGAEPLHHLFTPLEFNRIISAFASPGSLLFTKNRQWSAEVQNCAYQWRPAFTREAGRNKPWVLKIPTPKPTKYYTRMRFMFSISRIKDISVLCGLLDDICTYFDAPYGLIFHQETKELFYKYKDTIPFDE